MIITTENGLKFEISKDRRDFNWDELNKKYVKGTVFEGPNKKNPKIEKKEYFIYSSSNPIGHFELGHNKETKGNLGLLFMAINQKYRGQGIGKEIINFAKQEAKKQNETKLYLVTRSHLFKLIKYYETLGFKYEDYYYHLWLKDGQKKPFSTKEEYEKQKKLGNITKFAEFNRYFCDV